jgi:outer membrane cobalamin receptor
MRHSLFVLAWALLVPRCLMAAELPGSIAGDSLLMPTESYVLTREELIERNIHTLDDILQALPGVVIWREGPHGAYGGFSIDGRSHRGLNLLVNGIPVVDRYMMESLTRFLPLSRLLRVEVVYSGSPCFSGDLSSRGFINLVIEEGGREGPTSEVDFTYGSSNRRARRAWFATPRSYVSGALAYDEYLQDGIEAYPEIPRRLLGKDDMRSVLAELGMRTSAGDDVVFRLQRYEDSYVGTSYSYREDVRRSGFGSQIIHRRAGFSSSITQSVLELARLSGRIRERSLGGGVRWSGALVGLKVRVFASVERAEFENDLWDAHFAPSYSRLEGGGVLGGRLPSNVTWRLGAFGGDHSAVGRYGSAEVAVAKGWSERFSQDVVIARRLRVPSAQELFQPALPRTIDGAPLATAGNPDLAPEISDELSFGFRLSGASLSLFGRSEKSMILLSGSSPAVYRSEGSGTVSGVRARFSGHARILGIDCNLSLGVEGYPGRDVLASGVPRYRAAGEAGLRRRIFSGTELISLKLDSQLAGERQWNGAALPAYHVHNVSASLSIMSARVSFEYRNILNERYETVPGYTMPPRHYIIGVFWELFD